LRGWVRPGVDAEFLVRGDDEGSEGYAPQSLIKWIFTKKSLCWDVGPATLFSKVKLLPKVFRGPQICQKCVGSRGFAPDPTGGAHDATHRPPNRLWRGYPQCLPALGAFGASILAPSSLSFCAPNVNSWLRP